ncbi:MAG: PAS domain-containing protein [Cyclobacteriaceae bacterium]
MIDLQETARIKEAIEANPQNFEKIIEDTKLAICITNEDQNFVAVNNNYLKLYEFEREELIGQSFLKVVPQETQDELAELHDKFIEIQIEMMRDWVVLSKTGKRMKISVDAGFSDKINNEPHKITFVMLEEILA